jgi:hypothetical protein
MRPVPAETKVAWKFTSFTFWRLTNKLKRAHNNSVSSSTEPHFKNKQLTFPYTGSGRKGGSGKCIHMGLSGR